MAISAPEVRVAGAGRVYAAPEGTAIPGTLTDPTGDFVDLGYVTTDGVTFTFSRETEDLDAWQADKIRVLSSREPASVAFSLMQTNADVMVLALGGGDISDEGGGLYKLSPPKGDNDVRVIIVEFTDGGKTYRYCIPRAQIEGDVSYTLTRTGAVTYPLTFGLLDNDPDKYFILSDDAAMGGGTLPGTIGGGGGSTPVATANTGSGVPSAAADDGSVYVDTDTNDVYIRQAGAWVDSTVDLATAPAAVGIGTDDPTAGLAGFAEDDAYFMDEGAVYSVWIRGAGADTDWTDAGTDVTK